MTSPKGFGEWDEVLGGPVIAAILDRLLHHSHVLTIQRESYRLRERKHAGLFGVSSALVLKPGQSEQYATPTIRPGVGRSLI